MAKAAQPAEAPVTPEVTEAPPVDPAPTPAPPPVATKSPGEEAHYTPVSTDIPNELPEKFMKDGKPDYDALTKSYVELEKMNSQKTEDLAEQREGTFVKAAEEYTLPEIEVFDGEEMKDHPLMNWWRNEAFTNGLSQEQFTAGIEEYAKSVVVVPDSKEELKKLGDNATQRVAAVSAWAEKFKDKPQVYDHLDKLAYTAEGIETLEAMMSGDTSFQPEEVPVPEQGVTLEKLKTMQDDPRYWDVNRRDPEFVKQIEDGYAKLYAQG